MVFTHHIFNRGTNRENIFRKDENYLYFLKMYVYHIMPVADTFAYCLMPNHFHLLVRTHDEHLEKQKSPAQAFSNFFNAYARAFNKRFVRTCSLFEHPYHRIVVDSNAYFTRLIAYIHRNPSKHGFTEDFREWKYSSYQAMLSNQPSQVERETVLQWFGGLFRFQQSHEQFMTDQALGRLTPDDLTRAKLEL